jgi:hypothetical protein
LTATRTAAGDAGRPAGLAWAMSDGAATTSETMSEVRMTCG